MPPKPMNLGGKPAAQEPTVNNSLTVDYGAFNQPVAAPVPTEQRSVTMSPAMASPYGTPSVGTALTLQDVGKRGEAAQMQVAEATKQITGVAKLSDMDELGKLLGETLLTAKGYDPANSTKGKLFGLIKRKMAEVRLNFEKVDGAVNQLVGQIDQRVTKFRGRVTDLERIQQQNMQYHNSLDGEIQYLKDGVAWMEANRPQVDPSDTFSAQKAQEWETIIAYASKRADDLRRAQIVCQQQDAQINLMKQNSLALAQKFTDLKVTTLPLLQQTFTLYIINVEQAKGAQFAGEIDDLTEQTLQQNAKMLGQNTTAIHTALTRSNVSIEAVQANHQAVIDSLNEIERIRAEMKQRLATEAPQLEQASRDLAARLAQPAR